MMGREVITMKQERQLPNSAGFPLGDDGEEYLARIHSYYHVLSEAERRIGDYLLTRQGEEVKDCTVEELAGRANVSTATIVRFCRTIGFSGFSEFKVYLQRRILSPLGSNSRISAEDPAMVVKRKVADLSRGSIESAVDVLDPEELERAIELVTGASRVFIGAEGGIGGIAQTVAGAFLNAGMECYFMHDGMMQAKYAYMLSPQDVMIAITNSGYEKTVIDSQVIARSHGVPTISVTSIRGSLATKHADVVLLSSQRDNQNPLDLMAVVMGHMVVLGALQMGCAARSAQGNRSRIVELHKQRLMKLYDLELEDVKINRVRF